MDKNLKIVFIIGNGFDLDLGRNTSYKDFWESEFCPKHYPAPIIKHLNGKWPDSIDAVKWYDLENELLNYFVKIEKFHRFHDVIDTSEKDFINRFNPEISACRYYDKYQEQVNSLSSKGYLTFDPNGWYITVQDLDDLRKNPVERDKLALLHIKSGLCEYLKNISQAISSEGGFALSVIFALTKSKNQGNVLNIYNFNYTKLPCHYAYDFSDCVHYVHGQVERNNIIIGTKDYEPLGTTYDFLQKSFDPNYNPPAVVYDLLDADDVVIFGHSLGTNDSQYFKAFFKQQSSSEHPKRKRITIFTKNSKSEIEIKRSLQQMTDYNLSSLFGLNELKVIKTDELCNDVSLFRSFLERYLTDPQDINAQIRNIKRDHKSVGRFTAK